MFQFSNHLLAFFMFVYTIDVDKKRPFCVNEMPGPHSTIRVTPACSMALTTFFQFMGVVKFRAAKSFSSAAVLKKD
jgi:hypothetical protein